MARVLVVEDDSDVTGLLVRCLRKYGHTVWTAQSGPLALRTVGIDRPVDVALLDYQLPGMSGLELLSSLRRHPELDNPKLPGIFLSGNTTPEFVADVHAVGAIYLPKPFVSTELQCAILKATGEAALV